MQRVDLDGRRGVRPLVVAAVVAVLGLLLAGLVLGDAVGGDSDDGERASPEQDDDDDNQRGNTDRNGAGERTTATTRSPRSTTTAPTTTVALGPPLGAPVSVDLLVGTDGGSWTWVQLDTGLRREVNLDLGAAPESVGLIGVRGGVVGISDGAHAYYHPLPVGDPVPLGRGVRAAPGPDDDSVWIIDAGADHGVGDPSTVARLVALDGSPIGPPAVVAAAPWVFGSTGAGLVFVQGGRVFEATAEGVRAIASGEVRAVARGHVAVYTCDDDATCWTEVIDTSSGGTTTIRADGDPSDPLGLSPSGWVARISSGRQTLDLHDPAGELVGSVRFLLTDTWFHEQVVTWLPDGTTVLAPAHDGVELIRVVDGEVVSTELPADLDASQAIVIPR